MKLEVLRKLGQPLLTTEEPEKAALGADKNIHFCLIPKRAMKQTCQYTCGHYPFVNLRAAAFGALLRVFHGVQFRRCIACRHREAVGAVPLLVTLMAAILDGGFGLTVPFPLSGNLSQPLFPNEEWIIAAPCTDEGVDFRFIKKRTMQVGKELRPI